MAIKLHKFGEVWGIADPSPYCLKLESFLKEAHVPYECVPFDPMRTLSRAPKGKLPFIEAEDGTLIGNSTLIIDWLSHKHDIDADAPLGSEQRAVSLAFRRMLDEHLYCKCSAGAAAFDQPWESIVLTARSMWKARSLDAAVTVLAACKAHRVASLTKTTSISFCQTFTSNHRGWAKIGNAMRIPDGENLISSSATVRFSSGLSTNNCGTESGTQSSGRSKNAAITIACLTILADGEGFEPSMGF